MKKLFIVLGAIITISMKSLPAYANDLILLFYERPIFDPETDRPKVPVRPPHIEQEGHTLYFPDEVPLSVNLYINDDDRQLVYSFYVLEETECVQLPAELQGTYSIEVIRGEQHFWGEVELD